MGTSTSLKPFLVVKAVEGLELALVYPDKTTSKSFEGKKLDQLLLVSLDKFVKVPLKDLAGIACVNDQGSFVTLRLVLSDVNTLAWANGLKVIPLTSKDSLDYQTLKKKLPKTFKPLKPSYTQEPEITKSKKKYSFLK